MRRMGAFAAAALAAVVLAGCSTGSSGAAVTPAATAPFEKMDDATFIAAMRSVLSVDPSISNEQIFDLIDVSCTLLSHGTTGRELQDTLIDSGETLATVGDALNVIRLGVANYCPAHTPEFDYLVPK